MLYLVTFTWGDKGILTEEQLANMLALSPSPIVFYEVYEPTPPPEPEPEPEPEPVPVEFAGTISRKQLEYDEARASIPAYNLPSGQRGLIHIWGLNDMATTQALGIGWVIFDPDGLVVEEYNDWSYGHGPDEDHEFIGGRFPLDKEGIYIISVVLKMSPPPAYPTAVDTYYGTLCTVGPVVPEPEFRGFDITEYAKR